MLRRLFGGWSDHPPAPEVPDAPVPAVDATLASLEAGSDQFAIFDAGRGRYVQVSVSEAGLYGEAVSNAFLKGAERLDDIALQTLERMGWAAGGPDSNFTRTWARWTGDDRSRVVDDIVGTLTRVYGLPSAGPLDITTGT
jgi:hypothetical protein